MRLGDLLLASLLAAAGCSELVEGVVDSVADSPQQPAPAEEIAEPTAPGPVVALPRCEPTVGGTLWVEEGQELRAQMSCATGAEIEGGFFAIKPLPAGATWNAERSELRWIPGLDQAGVYELQVHLASGETGSFKIGVADRFDSPANVPVADPARYTEELGLPVFHLTVDPQVNPDTYTPATLLYRGRTHRAQARHKGNSSLAYPKKSFTIEFAKGDEFGDQAFGFTGKRKIVLRAMFDDNSYLRDRLAYELWSRLGQGKVRIQTYSAVVFVNGTYQGLYTVVDHIDKFLMAENGMSSKGNLFKGADPAATFYPSMTELPGLFEKTSGEVPHGEEGAFDDLLELATFVDQSEDEVFRAEVGRRLAIEDYRAWLILVTAIQARDTLGKNTYHYHDPVSGRWRAIPWDFNHSFGQDWMTSREDPNIAVHAMIASNRVFVRLWEDQVLGPETRARYKRALAEEIPADVVLGALDALVEQITPVAKRDERRWRQHYLTYERWSVRTDFTDFDEEVQHVHAWIRDRWTFLNATL